MTPEQMTSAHCRFEEPDVFFNRKSQAVSVCQGCPVSETCLEEAMRAEWGEPRSRRHGVFGGLLPHERFKADADYRAQHPRKKARQPEQRSKPPLKLAPCGTRSAYQRHVRKGEPIDEPCRIANNQADRRLRNTGSTQLPAVVLEPQAEQAPACGTEAAYQRHQERGEAIDPTCWNAARRRHRAPVKEAV